MNRENEGEKRTSEALEKATTALTAVLERVQAWMRREDEAEDKRGKEGQKRQAPAGVKQADRLLVALRERLARQDRLREEWEELHRKPWSKQIRLLAELLQRMFNQGDQIESWMIERAEYALKRVREERTVLPRQPEVFEPSRAPTVSSPFSGESFSVRTPATRPASPSVRSKGAEAEKREALQIPEIQAEIDDLAAVLEEGKLTPQAQIKARTRLKELLELKKMEEIKRRLRPKR